MFEDFSVSGLIAGFFFGVIGLWMFKEGKRRVNYTVVFISIALMLYPYVVPGAWLTWIVGSSLCGLAYYFW